MLRLRVHDRKKTIKQYLDNTFQFLLKISIAALQENECLDIHFLCWKNIVEVLKIVFPKVLILMRWNFCQRQQQTRFWYCLIMFFRWMFRFTNITLKWHFRFMYICNKIIYLSSDVFWVSIYPCIFPDEDLKITESRYQLFNQTI